MLNPSPTAYVSAPSLPLRARRYLDHAVSADALDARAVEVSMHGELWRNGRWLPFTASETLDPKAGLEWRAELRWGPAHVSGCESLREGRGEIQWRLFDRVSMSHLSGPDITRFLAGRAAFDTMWMPTWLASDAVTWTENIDGTVRAQWGFGEEVVALDLVVDPAGRPRSARTMRWGNPDGQGWRPIPYGMRIEEERTIAGVTVPSQITAGWWFGEDRFEREGLMLRVLVDDIQPIAD